MFLGVDDPRLFIKVRRIWVKGRLPKPIEFFPRFGGVQARKAYLRAVISEIRAVDNKSALSAIKPHFRPSSLAKMPAMQMLVVLFVNGAPDWIRTNDLCLRRATLYPAELRVPEPTRRQDRAQTVCSLFNAQGQYRGAIPWARDKKSGKKPIWARSISLKPFAAGVRRFFFAKACFCFYFNGQSLA